MQMQMQIFVVDKTQFHLFKKKYHCIYNIHQGYKQETYIYEQPPADGVHRHDK